MVRSATLMLLPLVACLWQLPTPAGAAEINLAGDYQCDGVYSSGGAYTYQVRITKRGETYHVKWTSPSDKKYLVEGVGILKDNTLAVGFDGSTKGVALFFVEKGGQGPKLVGNWSGNPGDGTLGRETLNFLKP